MTSALASFKLRLLAERDHFAALDAMVPAAKLLDRVLAELDEALHAESNALVSRQDAAEAVRCAPDSITRLIRTGKVRNYAPGGRRPLVRVDEVIQALGRRPMITAHQAVARAGTANDNGGDNGLVLDAVAGSLGRAGNGRQGHRR